MRLELHENLPVSARPRLADLGFDVDTVLDEKLGGRDDSTIWAAAQAERRLLITHDLDFSDVRKFAPGTHEGIVLLRLPEGSAHGGLPGRLLLDPRGPDLGEVLRRRVAASHPSPASCTDRRGARRRRWPAALNRGHGEGGGPTPL